MKDKSLLLIAVLILFNCKNEPTKRIFETTIGKELEIKYAKGFSVKDYGTYKILGIKNPWQNGEKIYRYALLKNGYDADFWSSEKIRFDDVFEVPIEKIVVTSTTHIPALDLLNVENTLVGFPETDFISSEKIRALIDNGAIRELGKNESINTEVLLETKPDLVVGFGVDGKNKAMETIATSGIPVIYNNDWVEDSPLAKAEWIKFFGVLYDKEKEADSIFNDIEKNYQNAQLLVKNITDRPTVLSGAMHNDVWYLPTGTSTEAQLLHDAKSEYLWKDTSGSGSLKLSFETVFAKAKNADIWLSPSNYSTLNALKHGNNHNDMFKAFQEKNIYSFTNTRGKTGGILYYELGMARPDLVLKDLIKICHPELLQNYDLYFFKTLE